MNESTDVAEPVTWAKASLKQEFPDWNIVYSSEGRWWAFLDPRRQRKGASSNRVTAVDADTSEVLRERLAEVES